MVVYLYFTFTITYMYQELPTINTNKIIIFSYTTSFNPDYRYGKRLKWLPPGFWFKNSVKYESGNENKNNITDFISNVLERYLLSWNVAFTII